jgi:hypothetical protein
MEGERHDEELRPLREAGQGEAEGFEQSEEELIEHATHGDPGPDPSDLAGEPEDAESAEAVYGEPDHERSSETESADE